MLAMKSVLLFLCALALSPVAQAGFFFGKDNASLEVEQNSRVLRKNKSSKSYKSSKKGKSSKKSSKSSSKSSKSGKSSKKKGSKSSKGSPTAAPVAVTPAPVEPTPAPVPLTTPPVQPTPAPVAPTPAPITPTRAPTFSPTPGVTSVVVFICSDDCGGVAADVTQQSFIDALGPDGEAVIAGGNACGQACNPGRRRLQTTPTGASQLTILNLVSFDLDATELLQLCIDNLPGTSSLIAPPTFPPTDAPTTPPPTDVPTASLYPSSGPTGAPTVSAAPSSAPSIETVTVIVEANVQTTETNATVVSDAFVQSVSDAANGITRRRLAPSNTTYVFTGNCTAVSLPLYTCVCESLPVSTTDAQTANSNIVDDTSVIETGMQTTVPDADVTSEETEVTTDGPTSSPTESQYPSESPSQLPRRLLSVNVEMECECNLDGITVSCIRPEHEASCVCKEGDVVCEE